MILGRSVQCYDALRQGLLIYPFGPVLELDLNYYPMCRPADAQKPHIVAFMDWAETEAAALTALRSYCPAVA